jgi:hypothetical protein
LNRTTAGGFKRLSQAQGVALTLDSLGITATSLNYTQTPITDAYGNQFRLKGHLKARPGDQARMIYDVNLVTQ